MRFLYTLPIRARLNLAVMIATCTALSVLAFVMIWFDQVSFREWMCRYARTRADIIGNNSTAALGFCDPQPVQKLLQTFVEADPNLVTLAVYDRGGSLFVRQNRTGRQPPANVDVTVESVEFTDDGLLQVTYPIREQRKLIGSVLIATRLTELQIRRERSVSAALLALLAAAGIGYVLAAVLRRFITRPLLNLSDIARAVAAEKNYSIRVPRQNDDEVGQLVVSFNEMLAQIEGRDAALREVQAELERRVIVRTSELHEAKMRLEREAEERFQVQEALRRSEERFSKAFRASPVPLAILTRGSRAFVDVNDRFADLAGRKRDQIIGDTMFALPVWTRLETRARLERLLADGSPLRNWECEIMGKDGKLSTALLSAESFVLGGESCLLLMTEDISERVNLETQLRQAQKMDAIGQLASGVAHDFNNLLTIIQGYTQLMLGMQSPDSTMRDPLEKIDGASQRAAKLTGQLLTFSRKQVAQMKPLDLNQVIGKMTSMLKPLLGEQVQLSWRGKGELPPVEADSGMLEQVVVNLAVNARDAMDKGGELAINTFVCEIDGSYKQYQQQAAEGRFVCLQVSDTGSGMDAATLERIFEPFFTTKGVGKGTGLGLATVYGIIKQHRGWVEVASQVGVGTTFKIFLPVAAVAKAHANERSDTATVHGGNETIMVVEDEPALRLLVIQILRGYGYRVIEAQHGNDALNVWRRTSVKPDLLLTDMMMPGGMTGWQLGEQLRAEQPGLKIIYTSGYSPELFDGKLQLQDSSNFIPKPFHPRVLAKTIRHCLDN